MSDQVEKKIQEVLQENKQSLDDIQQHIWDIITINQLTTAETAAMFTSLMRQILGSPHNQNILGVELGDLNLEAITTIQKMLAIEYLANKGYLR